MKRLTILFAVLAVFLWVGSAVAGPFGTNITIYDNRGTGTGWHGGPQEDQEVEPGMVATQAWDLEGFFLNGTTLTMVGGFDFKNGYSYGEYLYRSGDIFIDVDGNASFGNGANNANASGYDYVFDLNFGTGNYNVYALDSTSNFTMPFYYNNPESSPWQFSHTDEASLGSGTMVLYGYDGSDPFPAELGFGGETHYAVSVDLADLGLPLGFFISHFTMECGNDNLMGQNPVPEPATMFLFGTGLIGLAAVGRKKLIKQG